MIDRAALLAHIKTRAEKQASLPAAAVLDALATAIQRGDFDTKEGIENGRIKENTIRSTPA